MKKKLIKAGVLLVVLQRRWSSAALLLTGEARIRLRIWERPPFHGCGLR